MKNERLKQNVMAFMDYAKGTKDDLSVSRAKLNHDIRTGKSNVMTESELDEAFAFVKDNYFEVVEARKSGDFAVMDELVETWDEWYEAAPSEETENDE